MKSETLQQAGKRVSESRVVLAQLMQPIHANNHGNVHGGEIMRLMDEAGALACMRHAGQRVVTVAVDRMTFRQPIHLGDLITLSAEVSYVGHTSLEAEVLVSAENPITGECVYTNTGYLVYVALDDQGQPVQVPPLIPENEEHQQRMADGKARQIHRLSRPDRRE
ncbi:MAG TPA: acyl-CoA thioesterase [Chloroflexi bacterium]|nr:acyl-CoA thioesterase [Chloroflexota bacterium]HBY07701.1 acyl-CoA thioesterase [Chloroflexota bacterium]